MWLDAPTGWRANRIDAVMAGVPIYVPGRLNRPWPRLSRPAAARVTSLMKRNAGKFRRV